MIDENTLVSMLGGVSTAIFGILITIVSLVPALLDFIKTNASSSLDASLGLEKITNHLKYLTMLIPLLAATIILAFTLILIDSYILSLVSIAMLVVALVLTTTRVVLLATEIRNLL